MKASDCVRKVEVLRRLFHSVHTLKNELLARGERAGSADDVRRAHDQLAAIPGILDDSSKEVFAHLMKATSEQPLEVWLRQLASQAHASAVRSKARGPVQETPLPEFLAQPDRNWEKLLWQSAQIDRQWELESIHEETDLREFAARSKERERELSKHGIVLAVLCHNGDGMVRNWEWLVLVPQSHLPLSGARRP